MLAKGSNYTRGNPQERRAQILAAAVNVARTGGYLALYRSNVARQAGVAEGLVNRYFGTMDSLRDAVMREAIEQRLLPLLAQGITHGNPVALQAPDALRGAAVVSVGGEI